MTTWDPNHESTHEAWAAIVTNLHTRHHHDGWGSFTIALAIARNTGLTTKRAGDLIRSAIKHGYLEQRHPILSTKQVRLIDQKDGV